MTPARKRRIWLAHGGKCVCGVKVPMLGAGVTYDHWLPIWFGRRPDTDEEVRPLCDACDAIKTPADQTRIAKTKRQAKLNGPREQSKRPLNSQGFRGWRNFRNEIVWRDAR